jgi:hypothetical protein
MGKRPDRVLTKGFARCLLVCGFILMPLSASPGTPPRSGLVPLARQQIQVTASVRPTLQVQQQTKSKDGTRAFCVWSNRPMPRYDVKLEQQRGPAISRPQVTVVHGGTECSRANLTASLIRSNEGANENNQISVVSILIISPD